MISLVKLKQGEKLSLAKELKNALVGLGWDARVTSGTAFDLDASAFLLTNTGKVRGNQDFVFYGQYTSDNGAVTHGGDNLTGQGDGDDETLKIKLDLIPAEISRIVITVTIHEAQTRNQNFGGISNAFIRIVNEDTGQEITRYDLGEDYSTETAVIFGELYRNDGKWEFKAVGQGYNGGLQAMCDQYGVIVS